MATGVSNYVQPPFALTVAGVVGFVAAVVVVMLVAPKLPIVGKALR